MKTYLIAVCAAAVLVGCAHDRGGVNNRSTSESGSSMPSTNSISNTNDQSNGTQSQSSGTQGSTSDKSSGAGSQDNQDNQPKN